MTLEALKMGNYGPYVWSSYGLTLLSLIAVAWSARSSWQQQLKLARRRIQIADQIADSDANNNSGRDSVNDAVDGERTP